MHFALKASVGNSGNNHPFDVMNVKAALNVHFRAINKRTLGIYAGVDAELIAAIRHVQLQVLKQKTPDGLIRPKDPVDKWLRENWIKSFKPSALLRPKMGLLTWESEGFEGGPNHSRKLHVPTDNSGLTIGRGYDCAMRTPSEISRDLVSAGLTGDYANTLARAAGLRGSEARYFVIKNDLLDWEISPDVQLKLFELILPEYERRAKAMYETVSDRTEQVAEPWKNLHQTLRDVQIDLAYRDDLTGKGREISFQAIRENSIPIALASFSNQKNWEKVPKDRFQRRVSYLQQSKQ